MNRVPAELQTEIQQFLTHEAWLLDTGKLRDWLGLFTEDVRYRMPVRATKGSGMGGTADKASSCSACSTTTRGRSRCAPCGSRPAPHMRKFRNRSPSA